MKGTIAAQDLAKLQLNAQVGEVEIRGIKTDAVRWWVELEPQKKGRSTATMRIREKLGEIKVHVITDITTLHLDLKYPDGLDHDDVKHRWHLEIPAAFAVNVIQDAGEMKVADVSGGVTGKLGVGNAKAIVPIGNVSLSVGTGNANVISSTSSVGTIELHSSLGHASAQIGNKRLASTRFVFETDLNHVGNGDDDYWISVGVGNAQLEIKTR